MPSDPMKKLKLEGRTAGPIYEMPRKRRFRGRHILIIVLIAAAGFGVYRTLRGPALHLPWHEVFLKKTVLQPVERRPAHHVAALRQAAADPFEIRHLTLHAGDTFDKIVKLLNISGPNLKGLRTACAVSPFDHIGKNDEVLLVLKRVGGQPERLVYLRSGGGAYTFRKSTAGWQCGSNENGAAMAGKTVQGVWSKSFYHSCVACGLPAPLILRLADIFSYDVDVLSNFKAGDSFSVFFQQYPIESSRDKRFLILAAQMNISGKLYQAFGFQLPDGSWDYFDASGSSMERQFTKAPLKYRTLLQDNGGAVLKVFRPHFEIMYVVPAGAQVCAVGDGVVLYVHRFGKRFSIAIRHPGGYVSWYGNLSACTPGLRRGTPVSRSMVIGSVVPYGSGKAFFDFRLFKKDKPVNFETARFAPLSSVPGTIQARFEKTKAVCLAALSRETMAENRREVPSGKK